MTIGMVWGSKREPPVVDRYACLMEGRTPNVAGDVLKAIHWVTVNLAFR